MRILVIDIGGTNIKLLATGKKKVRKVPSGPHLTAEQMVLEVRGMTSDWEYDAVTIGYPGPIVEGAIQKEPVNLGPGWVDFDFTSYLACPVKLINDAAMQALGSYHSGRMLYLGLGTGLGTALVLNGVLIPMEGGHLPYRKRRSFEDYVGTGGMERRGRNKWEQAVHDVVEKFRATFLVDDVVLGGGNAKKLRQLPAGTRLGDNRNAFLGGFRLWEDEMAAVKAARQR